MGSLIFCHIFGRASGNDLPTTRATLRSQINEPVSGFDDIQIVRDDYHRIAAVSQPVQHFQ